MSEQSFTLGRSSPPRCKAGEAAVIVAHNHPSGNVDPSDEDREITTLLRQAGETLGISLLDHIIFTQNSYYSFLKHGEL